MFERIFLSGHFAGAKSGSSMPTAGGWEHTLSYNICGRLVSLLACKEPQLLLW